MYIDIHNLKKCHKIKIINPDVLLKLLKWEFSGFVAKNGSLTSNFVDSHSSQTVMCAQIPKMKGERVQLILVGDLNIYIYIYIYLI